MWWMVQSQLTELWDPQRGLNTDGSLSPLMALQSHSRRETFMVKRIILDTNSYVLAFSAAFMILHSVFSFLAFKNGKIFNLRQPLIVLVIDSSFSIQIFSFGIKMIQCKGFQRFLLFLISFVKS